MKNDKSAPLFRPVLIVSCPGGGIWITRLPGMSLAELYLRELKRNRAAVIRKMRREEEN